MNASLDLEPATTSSTHPLSGPPNPAGTSIFPNPATQHSNIGEAMSAKPAPANSHLKAPKGTAKDKKPSLPAKARSHCTACNHPFRPPKTKDTTLCTSCRVQEEAASTLAANVDTAGDDEDDTIQLPQDFIAVGATKHWDAKINSVEIARFQLLNKEKHSVQVEGDDFEEVDDEAIVMFSKEMFDALLKAPCQPPDDFDAAKKARYVASQLTAYKDCANLMETEDEVSDASARCRLAVVDAITLHGEGIRLSELKKDSVAAIKKYEAKPKKSRRTPAKPETRTGFHMDVDVTCIQRIEMMIKGVSQNKLVARELLDGRKVQDLVRCPTGFLERKGTSFKGNRMKHGDEKEGGDLRRKREEALLGDPQAGTGSKRKTADEDESEVGENQAAKRVRQDVNEDAVGSQTFDEGGVERFDPASVKE